MNPAPSTTQEYLFLLRGTQFEKRLSMPEMEEAMDKYYQWLDRLSGEGKFQGGKPLAAQGKVIRGKRERTIADGPFAEAKEAIGGYLVFTAEDLESAVSIAATCPLLDYEAEVEVRPILKQCVPMQMLAEHRNQAAL